MKFLEIKNNIKINNVDVLIDAFVSNKNNSLTFIFNNYHHIKNTTSIDLDKTIIKYKQQIITYKILNKFNDFYAIEGFNPINYFHNRFHHDIFIVDNFDTYYVDNNNNYYFVELSFFNSNNELIFEKNVEICDINKLFLDKKCVTTIHYGEYNLIPSWIKYHKKIGFETFIIYDNNLDKSKIDLLYNEVKDCDDVYIIDAFWDYWLTSYSQKQSVGQCIQQNHCIWKYSPKFLLLTDLDEYVNVKNNYNLFNLNNFILSIPNWFFGCSNKIEYNYNNFLHKLIKKARATRLDAQRKCLIQSEFVDLFCVHCPIIIKKNIEYLDLKDCYLNHYIILSYKKRICDCNAYCNIYDSSIVDINQCS